MQPQALDTSVPAGSELLARPQSETRVFGFGPFQLVPAQRLLLEEGRRVALGSRAFDILSVLIEHAGEIVPNDAMMRWVWPRSVVEAAALRVHVAALRKALGDGRNGRRFISTVPQRGYCFVGEVDRSPQGAARLVRSRAGASTVQSDCAESPTPGLRALPTAVAMVGRDGIVERLATTPAARCMTLTGPGGVGKSTVALALAHRLAPTLADGVAYVDLSALDGGQPLLGALALALAVGDSDGRASSLRGLVALGCSKQMLLVLDNCDPVLEAVAATSEQLLRQLPELRIIATSREPLRIREERIERLPPLSIPPPGVSMSLREAKQYAAVDLFVTLAERVAGPVGSADTDAADIIQICRRLDGLPLALELAAAQLHPLGLRGLACALREGRGPAAPGFRTAPPRHRSVKASLDWSLRLLGDADRALLRRLGQLPDRFTAEAAENLCGLGVGETLADLVRKSLLVVYVDDERICYGFLETTRSYLVAMEREHPGRRDTLPSCPRSVEYAETPSRSGRRGPTPVAWRLSVPRSLGA